MVEWAPPTNPFASPLRRVAGEGAQRRPGDEPRPIPGASKIRPRPHKQRVLISVFAFRMVSYFISSLEIVSWPLRVIILTSTFLLIWFVTVDKLPSHLTKLTIPGCLLIQ